MTRERKKAPAPAHGVTAATRRTKMERASQYNDSVWRSLNPLKAPPKVKHKSYFEAVENADRKKKLEFEITTDKEPPPGFEFVPTGHPELSQECKEKSRESDAMFFIVSISKNTLKLDHHMNRLGYHFRWPIVEAARKALRQRGCHDKGAYVHELGRPEPIPKAQWEIDKQADAVLRDLFPRIPNTDRQEIIDHAFKKDGTFNGEFKVGMAKDITLARRVQLAALAHIRHTHTRYDALLKESDWANARKAVEKPCLDIIVKWRGDEETGRDQLDEILREVIEISDTEDESEDESSSADTVRIRPTQTGYAPASIPDRAALPPSGATQQVGMDSQTSSPVSAGSHAPPIHHGPTRAEKRIARRTQKRFKRYAAAAEALANYSNQGSNPESHSTPGLVTTPMEDVRAHPVNLYLYRTTSSAVAHEPYIPRMPYGHSGIERMSISQATGVPQDRVAGASIDTRIHGGAQQFIRIPDAQRPKVGPYSAKYGQTHMPPLSQKEGIQDTILPSIEPKSPDGPRVISTEAPRMISRTIFEPVASGNRTRSPGTLTNDDELAAKRRRVTTYFHEDFERPSDSYIQAAPKGRNDDLRHPQSRYHEERRSMITRAPDRIVHHDVAWPPPGQEVRVIRSEDSSNRSRVHPTSISGNEPFLTNWRVPGGVIYQSHRRVATRQDLPPNQNDIHVRSSGNPIIIDGNNREPRRVVELRGSPGRDIYRTSPRETIVHGLHAQYPLIQEPQRVVYIEEATDHLRREPSNHHHASFHHQPVSPTYRDIPGYQSPNISWQHPAPEQSIRHSIPYDREHVQTREPHWFQSSTTRRSEIQAPLLMAPGFERNPGLQHHNYQSRPAVDPARQYPVPQRTFGNVIYRDVGLDGTRSTDAVYERGPQSFPVFPAPSSYAEIRGPPTHQRLHDHRDIIHVE
ncbi:hypothetical protein GGR50DRAFT_685303 [Xylaria sp. CBS 124048]|nr:hypothetical protein GGR50DRAFT_685303 [Xylaria sp. CBS 124048]